AVADADPRGGGAPLGDAWPPRLHRVGGRPDDQVGRGEAGDRRRRAGGAADVPADAGVVAALVHAPADGVRFSSSPRPRFGGEGLGVRGLGWLTTKGRGDPDVADTCSWEAERRGSWRGRLSPWDHEDVRTNCDRIFKAFAYAPEGRDEKLRLSTGGSSERGNCDMSDSSGADHD